MHTVRNLHTLGTLVFAATLMAPATSSAQQAQAAPEKKPMEAPAGKTYALAAETLNGYRRVQENLAEAAEKMPEEHYGFKPTPEVKSFGQHVAHIALSQYGVCAHVKNETNPKKDEKEEATRSKADTVALLKGSVAYCEPLVTGLTEAAMIELMPMGKDKVAKGLVPVTLLMHGDEVYGTMAVYLRLKGIVPPSTEKMNKMKQEQTKKSSQ